MQGMPLFNFNSYVAHFYLVLFFVFCTHSPFVSAQASNHTEGGSITIAATGELSGINPFKTENGIAANLIDLVFDSLIGLSPNLEMLPDLATSWDISPDRLSWTFELDPHIKFHNGVPLTSKDVAFTFGVFKRRNDTLYSAAIENIAAININNKHSITFVFKTVDQTIPLLFQGISIAPAALFDENGNPLDPLYEQHPIGTGAFKVVTLNQAGAEFIRHEDYFRGRPHLEKISFKISSNEKNLLALLINGDIDIKFGSQLEYNSLLDDIPTLKKIPYANNYLYAAFFNMHNPDLADTKVRQALNLAVNKHDLISKLLGGAGIVAKSVVSPSHTYSNPSISEYDFDSVKALELMGEVGWKLNTHSGKLEKQGQSFKLTLLYPNEDTLSQGIVNMISRDLEIIGVTLIPEPITLANEMTRVFQKSDFEAALFMYSNICGIQFDNFFWISPASRLQNFTSYHNAQVDRELHTARFSADSQKSLDSYQKFQQSIHDDPPALYLFWKNAPFYVNQRVNGINPNPFMLFHDMHQVWLDKE